MCSFYHLDCKIIFPIFCLLLLCHQALGQDLYFKDITLEAGLDYTHDFNLEIVPTHYKVTGGVAVGDYDNDGFPDFYAEVGDSSHNLLFHNLGNGKFEEVSTKAGLDLSNYLGAGPLFFDYNNDGFLDLILGSIEQHPVRLFKNKQDGTFEEVTANCGINLPINTYSISAGDYDNDGQVDLFLSHWLEENGDNHIWRNVGEGKFVNVDSVLNFYNPFGAIDYTFTGNFTDINNDHFADLLISSDFGTSQVWLNEQGERFRHYTNAAISDENGMGSAIGDYNNDGFLDWFVSSIYDDDGVTEGNWGASGNRLYQNLGDNHFADVTEEAGVRNGAWGWGASFADFDNDGFLDIIHTNGWPKGSDQFYADTTRIFLSNQDGTFRESAIVCEMVDTSQGRGLSVLDYDRDGDLDVLIANYLNPPKLWRNELITANNYLSVKPIPAANQSVVGTKIWLSSNGQTQMREIRCGTNYNAQNPLEAHFGLGAATIVDSLIIRWPNGLVQKMFQVPANQFLKITPVLSPSKTASIQASPNPFHEEVRFQVKWNRDIPVVLKIYSVQGVLIKTITQYTVVEDQGYFLWDGTNQDQTTVPAGVYIANMMSGNTIFATTKILFH